MAEQMVLNANKSLLSNGKFLSTCALRPAAIYGEGEERHLPRFLNKRSVFNVCWLEL